jgi:hypothetical protein
MCAQRKNAGSFGFRHAAGIPEKFKSKVTTVRSPIPRFETALWTLQEKKKRIAIGVPTETLASGLGELS